MTLSTVKVKGDVPGVHALKQESRSKFCVSRKGDWELTKPNRGSSWDLREQLGMKHRRKRRFRKVPASCDRFCLLSKSAFSFGSIRKDSVLLMEQVIPKFQSYTHTHTHTLTPTYTHSHTQRDTHIYTNTQSHRCGHTYTQTDTHIHIHRWT